MGFKFKANFQGAMPMGVELDEAGFYQVRCINTKARETRAGATRGVVQCLVMSGPKKDWPVEDGINFPENPHDKNYGLFIDLWATLYQSFGLSIAKLRKTGEIDGDKLLKKVGYMHFTPAVGDGFSKVRWLTKEQYESAVARLGGTPVVEEEPAGEPEEPAEEAAAVSVKVDEAGLKDALSMLTADF